MKVCTLKPYEGCEIERCVMANGERTYTAYKKTLYGERLKKCEAGSLKDLKKEIDRILDEEHKIGNFIGRRLGMRKW